MNQLTPDEAREQLAAVETLGGTTRATAQRQARVGAVFTGCVGVLVGAVLACSYAFAPHHKLAFALTFVVYGIALVLLVRYQRRGQAVSSRGWGRVYTASLAATMSLYVAGIFWVTSALPSWTLVGPYCVLVALPMVAGAAVMLRISERPVLAGSRR